MQEYSLIFATQLNERVFPTLFCVAMDVLPIQASAVACERFFLSAADTDTTDRNRLHPALMEALQILKYQLKQEHLNFVDELTSNEADYTIDSPVTTNAIRELEARGERGIIELHDLIYNAETWTACS
jgi:hypothetical protein